MKNNKLSILNLPVTIKNDVQVMSSIDLAKLCVGESKDAHSNFMKKAEKVLGDALVDFYDRENYGNNNVRAILLLPEREACLMAMSYSYELQARVYDAWQALKQQSQSQLQPDDHLIAQHHADLAKAYKDRAIATDAIKALESQQEATPLIANVKTRQQIEDEFMLEYINSSKNNVLFAIECNALRVKNSPFQAYKRRGESREMLRSSINRLINSGAISPKQFGIKSH